MQTVQNRADQNVSRMVRKVQVETKCARNELTKPIERSKIDECIIETNRMLKDRSNVRRPSGPSKLVRRSIEIDRIASIESGQNLEKGRRKGWERPPETLTKLQRSRRTPGRRSNMQRDEQRRKGTERNRKERSEMERTRPPKARKGTPRHSQACEKRKKCKNTKTQKRQKRKTQKTQNAKTHKNAKNTKTHRNG